ncbi:MAG: hypothetical protein JW882_13100 [Deltaproteobacteria bacterium]|nr:hypothetical protein [Deltaproteobacteria bacterium]
MEIGQKINIDGFVNRQKMPFSVIPAEHFDCAQDRETFDFAQDRELVERLIEQAGIHLPQVVMGITQIPLLCAEVSPGISGSNRGDQDKSPDVGT